MKNSWKSEEGGFSASRLPPDTSPAGEDFALSLARLRRLPDEDYWRECFRRFRQTRGWSEEKMERLGRLASACGEEQAACFAGESVEELYAARGLTLRELEPPPPGAMELFALYEAPGTVSLRSDLLREADEYLRSAGLDSLLGGRSCREVILAHEFYHDLECSEGRAVFTAAYRERSGLLGLQEQVPALGEIGAMSFARRLLSLDWNPFLLDCVILYPRNPGAAEAIAGRLLARQDSGERSEQEEEKRI